ncbi:MAG: hypothetical protein ACE5GB_01445 [Acidimicrobiales bacterium]
MIEQLRHLPPATWLRAVPTAAFAGVMIGVPSDLIDTPFFGRPIDTRAIDYVILAVTASLIGLIFAISARPTGVTGATTGADTTDETRAVWGGFVSFLAVGCPVCNQLVVGLVGTSGALSWWAPVQPLVGLAAIGLLLYALRRRLETYRLDACALPRPKSPSRS